MFGARHVDDGVEGNYGIESPRLEGNFSHVGLDEGAFGEILPGKIQLPGRDVNARDGEAFVREPVGHRDAGAAAEVEHGSLWWQEGGQIF
jgi:hypothetical protein